jgi:hypothetical protein
VREREIERERERERDGLLRDHDKWKRRKDTSSSRILDPSPPLTHTQLVVGGRIRTTAGTCSHSETFV